MYKIIYINPKEPKLNKYVCFDYKNKRMTLIFLFGFRIILRTSLDLLLTELRYYSWSGLEDHLGCCRSNPGAAACNSSILLTVLPLWPKHGHY